MYTGMAEHCKPLVNRYAYEAGITIINANYRCMPGPKNTDSISDGYAIVKDVLENAEKYGVDPTRVGLFGECGGAFITAGIGLLMSEDNAGHKVKF